MIPVTFGKHTQKNFRDHEMAAEPPCDRARPRTLSQRVCQGWLHHSNQRRFRGRRPLAELTVVDGGDVEGMAPGTGTPAPGGLTARQLLDPVRRIAMELPVAGMDVVEVSPPYDHAEITAFLANRVVLEALSGIAWRRRRASGRPARDPSAPLLADRERH